MKPLNHKPEAVTEMHQAGKARPAKSLFAAGRCGVFSFIHRPQHLPKPISHGSRECDQYQHFTYRTVTLENRQSDRGKTKQIQVSL